MRNAGCHDVQREPSRTARGVLKHRAIETLTNVPAMMRHGNSITGRAAG